MFQRHPALLVDVDAEEKSTTLLLVLDVHELQPFRGHDLLDLVLDPLGKRIHAHYQQKKRPNRPLSIVCCSKAVEL